MRIVSPAGGARSLSLYFSYSIFLAPVIETDTQCLVWQRHVSAVNMFSLYTCITITTLSVATYLLTWQINYIKYAPGNRAGNMHQFLLVWSLISWNETVIHWLGISKSWSQAAISRELSSFVMLGGDFFCATCTGIETRSPNEAFGA